MRSSFDITTALGGAAVIIGSMMPWLNLFAGLKHYPGILGVNGWLLVVAGVLLMLAPWASQRGVRWAPAAVLVSLTALGIVAYAGTGLIEITGDSGNALMVPRMGPGLPVALAGSLTAFIMALFAMRRPLQD